MWIQSFPAALPYTLDSECLVSLEDRPKMQKHLCTRAGWAYTQDVGHLGSRLASAWLSQKLQLLVFKRVPTPTNHRYSGTKILHATSWNWVTVQKVRFMEPTGQGSEGEPDSAAQGERDSSKTGKSVLGSSSCFPCYLHIFPMSPAWKTS